MLSEGPAGEAKESPGKAILVSVIVDRWTENGNSITLSFAVSLPKINLQFMLILPVVTVT